MELETNYIGNIEYVILAHQSGINGKIGISKFKYLCVLVEKQLPAPVMTINHLKGFRANLNTIKNMIKFN